VNPPRPPRVKVRVNPAVPPAEPIAAATATEVRNVPGLISATKERAEVDARRALREFVASWLNPDVPAGWSAPPQLLDAMVVNTRFESVERDYGTLYIAELDVDASLDRRAELVAAYNHEVVHHRLITLGGVLGFVLACLAVVSGYIRTDEVTKGYYTNRLRLLAAAGVGAAGAVIYHVLA
jgi:hypothetical protein